MGASVQPVQAPSDGDRISRNIAAMRSQGASEQDIEAYLTQHEGLQPQQAPESMGRGIGRALTQGATFNFGDKLGLVDPAKQKAFQEAHPWINALSEMAGGSVAPIAAATAFPALATGAGAVGLMTGAGAIAGAGAADPNAPDTPIMTPMGMVNVPSRLLGAGEGGAISGLLGAAGQKAAKLAQPMVSAVLDRMHPERVVARVSRGLLDNPALVEQQMAAANAIQPGSASIATTAVAREGTDQSRFLPMIRDIAANPQAAASAEAKIVGQRAAINVGKRALGDQMDQLEAGEITLTPKVRSAMNDVRAVLGGKAPDIPPADAVDLNPLGLEKSVPFEFDPAKKTMSLSDAREALSRLRFLARNAAAKGVDANGITEHDIVVAKNALRDVVYDQRPDFAPLDRQYATMTDHEAQTEDALAQLQRARANHAATTAYGLNPMSPGAAIVGPKHFGISAMLNKLATDKAAVADATNRMIVTPGATVQSLLSQLPKAGKPSALRAGLLAGSTIPGMQGLLSP